ncbi:Endo-1,3-alpha-glucanase agn1 [Saitozyma sp. JCM 24511]|nr:Endo-1,3-alpha-glucanase agn1 [Saitozyma sp. JCM 24511]
MFTLNRLVLALAGLATASHLVSAKHDTSNDHDHAIRAPKRGSNRASKRTKEWGNSGGLAPGKRAAVVEKRAATPTWTSVGCVQDGSSRVLTGPSSTSSSMTVESCQSYCYSNGYALAGVEYGDECHCGNALSNGLGGSLSSSSCNMACAGSSSETCGGFYTMNLYRMYTPVGCISDSSSSRSLSNGPNVISGLTTGYCAQYCSKAGYSYAGTQYGDEVRLRSHHLQCWCGNSYPSSRAVSSSSCNMACAGDSTSTCGGFYYINILSLTTTTTTVTTATSSYTALGCYTDSGSPRLLTGASTSSSSMTAAVCSSFCSASGYTYFGTEYSTQCFCGNSLDSSKATSSSTCSYACGGDSSSKCGGFYAISVYQAGSSSYPVSLGCYSDSSSPRLLTGTEQDQSGMTVSSCTSYCSGLGYTYAGVEYGYQCFCGNSLDSSKAISSSSCNYACQGSSSQTCGGFYAAGVYQLKATSTTSSSSSSSPTATASSSASSLGCYTDSGNPRLLTGPEKDYSGSLTPAICQSYCGSAGYTYAGVEYGYQCWCGNSYDSTKKTSDSSCTYKCAGDSSQVCGGSYLLNLYKSTNVAATTTASPTVSPTSNPTSASIVSSNAAVASQIGVATPASGGTKALYAHQMVGNTYSYTQATWASNIAQAQAAGIDGFALNMGIDSWQPDRVADAYAAASAVGFKMFFSFDFTSLTCGSGDLGTITGYVVKYANNGAQAKYNGNVLVSTFSGDGCTWNAGDVYTGWTNFRNNLKGQNINIYLIPAIFSATSTFANTNSWMDGEFNWNSGWPVNTGSNLDFSGDTTYLNALNAAGKGYMAALSPAFFTYYGPPPSYNKDWIYRSDNWLLATRFEMLIANRNKFDMVEIISWNDYGESHYVGPIGVDQPNSQGWTNGMPHTAWLSLIAYYAPAWKTGSYPTVTDQVWLWSRPHPKDATPTNPTNARPSNADYTDDNLYVVVTLASAANVNIRSGSNSATWSLPSGLSKLSLASSPGTIGTTITRGSTTVKNYDSTGTFTYVS